MEIQWHVVTELSDERRSGAERRLQKLAKDHRDLISVTINVEETTHQKHGPAEVKIRCHAKGRELIAREKADDANAALGRALESFEREVHQMREKRRERRH